ncbi:hypothetical protein IW262DRAFT_1302765 [Armillaria fumosa]|nr:hypothetical protein IW262DRAFT_1302765 [Armillaria fumosa]
MTQRSAGPALVASQMAQLGGMDMEHLISKMRDSVIAHINAILFIIILAMGPPLRGFDELSVCARVTAKMSLALVDSVQTNAPDRDMIAKPQIFQMGDAAEAQYCMVFLKGSNGAVRLEAVLRAVALINCNHSMGTKSMNKGRSQMTSQDEMVT